MKGLIERVVVPLDAAAEHRAAIGTAARLARRWGARLHGVFVEDRELLHFAGLPFARQVSLGLGVEPLTGEQMLRQLRAFAETARRELEEAARRHGVEWSFEISEAAVEEAALARSERDLLVAGTATRPIGRHFRVECRWWQVMAAAPVSFLLVHREWAASGAVVTLLRDRSPPSLRVLDAAAHCVEAAGGVLTVVCAAELAALPGFAAWLGDRLAPHGVGAQIEPVAGSADALLEHCAGLDCELLVLGAAAFEAQPHWLRHAAARANHGLLIVRG